MHASNRMVAQLDHSRQHQTARNGISVAKVRSTSEPTSSNPAGNGPLKLKQEYFSTALLSCIFNMPPPRGIITGFQLLLLLLPLVLGASSALNPTDRDALLRFMASADREQKLKSTWVASSDPCLDNWLGVSCKKPDMDRVTHLTLNNFNLQGSVEALSGLVELRTLSLTNNLLTGPIPAGLSKCSNLKMLYLGNNNFTGTIPTSLGSLTRLKKIGLGNNLLQGTIPPELTNLHGLLSLRLENNNLTGPIPDFTFPNMTDFNVSFNSLSGKIPTSLAKVSSTAFLGRNDGLCGPPLALECPAPTPHKHHKLTKGSLVIFIAFSTAILMILAAAIMFYCRKHSPEPVEGKLPVKKIVAEEQQSVETSSISTQFPEGAPDGEAGTLVFVEEKFHRFDLKDLLRASAELLGKGTVGTTYKAVAGDGIVVAVKRLIDRSLTERKDFEQQMELIGKLKHPNLVPLIAYYYYAKEEKLLVYDYLPNNSLYTRLHGNRSAADRAPLSWFERLRIAHGVAQGLAFLHRECEKMPHGNLKSSNVILDAMNEPRIADFGLFPFMNATQVAHRADGYKAPEFNVSKKVTQKADVYSFGVMLLELLTGRVAAMPGSNVDLPRWVNSVVREEWTAEVFDYELVRNVEEEMVYLLRIAMDCVSPSQDKRPMMSQVVKMIEDIMEASSPSEASLSTELPSGYGSASLSTELPSGYGSASEVASMEFLSK